MEDSIIQLDTLGTEIYGTYNIESPSVFDLFLDGGIIQMTILTLLLVFLLFAAWKAPAWVSNIGKIAAVSGFLLSLLAVYNMLHTLQIVGDLSVSIITGGLQCVLIPSIYGLIICLIAFVIEIIHKPRI